MNNTQKKMKKSQSGSKKPVKPATTVRNPQRQPRQRVGPRRGEQGVNSAAAAYATGQSSTAPKIQATRDSCRVVHRELVASISGGASAAFTVASTLAINPGLAATFPWLSMQAQAWELYRFNSLKACYYTRCPTTTGGSMMLVPDYDAADAAPSTETIASSYEDCAEDAPWKDITCTFRPAEMFPMGPKKFIRLGALAANEDIKTYDAANLFLCTVDSSAAAGWGKVWLEYDITFYAPQSQPTGSANLFAHYEGATPTSTLMLGAAPVLTSSSNINPISVTNETITFNVAGEYLIVYSVNGTTDTFGSYTFANGAAAVLSYGPLGTGDYTSGNASANYAQSLLVTTTAGGTVRLDNTVVAGLTASLYVIQTASGSA